MDWLHEFQLGMCYRHLQTAVNSNKAKGDEFLTKLTTVVLAFLLLLLPVYSAQVTLKGKAVVRGSVTISPTADSQTIYESIIAETAMANSESNHPLPLFGTWSIGVPPTDGGDADGYNPDWSLTSIAANHHIIPYATAPLIDQAIDTTGYWEEAMLEAATHGLPLSFISGNIEARMVSTSEYTSRACDHSPLACYPTTTIDTATYGTYAISPFGYSPSNTTSGEGTWYREGYAWGSSPQMGELQYLYPAPPRVIFLSNNESVIANWYTTRNLDWHYTHNDDGSARFSTGDTDLQARARTNDALEARTAQFQAGFRAGLIASAAAHSPAVTTSTWDTVAKFHVYNGLGPQSFGRSDAWRYISNHETNQFDNAALKWDGAEMSATGFYYWATQIYSDFRAISPNIEIMNYPFMIAEQVALKADFWFDLVVWAGGEPGNTFESVITSQGQTWTAARYKASVRWGMWITRPRIVRDFPNTVSVTASRSTNSAWHDVALAAVDEVYTRSTLTTFWRGGALVANTSRVHPYNDASIPAEYSSTPRMFMLTTSEDPGTPWSIASASTATILPVFAMARVMGTTPNRQWLVYAYSPQATISDVVVTIPDYDDITIDTTVAGDFWLVSESDTSVELVP